jgi:hypothetical protein
MKPPSAKRLLLRPKKRVKASRVGPSTPSAGARMQWPSTLRFAPFPHRTMKSNRSTAALSSSIVTPERFASAGA